MDLLFHLDLPSNSFLFPRQNRLGVPNYNASANLGNRSRTVFDAPPREAFLHSVSTPPPPQL